MSISEEYKQKYLELAFKMNKEFSVSNLLFELRKTEFETVRGAQRYHHAYKGGLIQHSYQVSLYLCYLTNKLNLQWERGENMYSALIVGLLHDLCKTYIYKNPTADYSKGHGDLSVLLCDQLGLKLYGDELVCIEHHMGVYMKDRNYCNEYNKLSGEYPNLLYTHVSDMISSQSNFDEEGILNQINFKL